MKFDSMIMLVGSLSVIMLLLLEGRHLVGGQGKHYRPLQVRLIIIMKYPGD